MLRNCLLCTSCRLDQLRHSLEDVEKRFSLATQRYNQYEGQYNTTEHEVGQMRSALKDAQKELNGLKSQLQKLTQDLDDETSERSNLLDKIKALRKEISELEKKFVGVSAMQRLLTNQAKLIFAMFHLLFV